MLRPRMTELEISSDASTVSGMTNSIVNGRRAFTDASVVSNSTADGTNASTALTTAKAILLGRNKETQQLQESFTRVAATEAASEVILVKGASGTGKTSLVDASLRNPVANADGFFVDAKFEQVRTNVPFPALTAVLSDLCDLVLQVGGLPSVRAKIEESIGDGDVAALSMLVSNLSQVTGKTSTIGFNPTSMSQAFQRFKIACKQLIRAIASPEHPVVIFLDDLQWGDPESLETLHDLMTADSNNILLIGVYRNDDPESQIDVEELFKVKNSSGHHLKTTDICLANLDKAANQELVATILRMPVPAVAELSDILYGKTDGNPFYLKELMTSLLYRGDLLYSESTSSWTWNTIRIRHKIDVSNNVLGIVQQRLHSLPHRLQSLLTIAAYIGFCFSQDMLTDFFIHEQESSTLDNNSEANETVEHLLNESVKMGLIEQVSTGTFRFRHDKIQKCILDNVTEQYHWSLSCRVGWFLHAQTSKYGHHTVFSAAYNLDKGLKAITNPLERLLVARINLSAGMEAKAVASFHSAAEYAGSALQILGTPRPWDSEYELTVGVCTLAVESKQCLGDFDEVKHLAVEILDHAKTTQEKWPAHKVAIEDYANRTGDLRKAIDMCVNATNAFGDTYPKRPNAINLIKPRFRVRRLLKHKTDEDLLSSSPLPDGDFRHIISDIHRCLQAYAIIIGDEVRFILSILRCLSLSIKNRYYTFMTPAAFSTYSFVCSMCGDYESASRYAALAERMLHRFKLTRGSGRVHVMAYGRTLHHTQPTYHCALGLRRGIEIALASSEIEEAHYCTALFSLFLFHSGSRLPEVARLLGGLHDQFSVYDTHHASFYRIILAATGNLMGLSDEPTKLSSNLIDEDEAICYARRVNNLMQVYTFQSTKASLLFHFGNIGEAQRYADKFRSEKRLGLQDHLNLFYFGLIYFESARGEGVSRQRRRRLLSLARKCLKGLRRVNSDNPNTKALLQIMEADHYCTAHALSSGKDLETMRSKYDEAISTAAQNEVPQFQALANERASMAMEQKLPELSAHYMQRAKELYWEWGAEAKCEYLEERDAEQNAQTP